MVIMTTTDGPVACGIRRLAKVGQRGREENNELDREMVEVWEWRKQIQMEKRIYWVVLFWACPYCQVWNCVIYGVSVQQDQMDQESW